MNQELQIKESTRNLVNKAEKLLTKEMARIDEICEINSQKVLNAFKKCEIAETHLNGTTGYGYNDIGREKIEDVYKEIFKSEDALVRAQFVSGTHALTVALFSMLRPNDTMLSITGLPYDTLHEVIGIEENPSSLKSYGIHYEQIDLKDNDFDYEKIIKRLQEKKIKLIEIQRSKGYSTRKSIAISKIEKVIQEIRKIDPEVIIMVDNCYCEFVNTKEPIEAGADIVVGSLIKNLGGGIAPNGAYIVGRKDLIHLAGERLTCPGEGKEVGPSLGINRQFLQGLFFAPSVVKSAVKTAVLTSKVMQMLGYKVEPLPEEERVDIVQNIYLNDPDKVVKYCQGIQAASPIDSNVLPIPWDMPGYKDPIVMAAGAFTQGSSIELSCDAPIRSPYIAYQQGGLTYEYGKLAVMQAVDNILEDKE